MQPSSRRLIDRMVERMPPALHRELRESTDRMLAIRTPKQAQRALESEYEHVLRLVMPVVIDRPLLRNRRGAAAFTAGFAALAATAEEADELLTLVSAGTLTAPGTSVVVAVGLLSAAAESYAAASVRVHQLRDHHCEVEAALLASDVRRAVLGDTGGALDGVTMAKRVLDGAAGRISRRWAVGAIPVVGIGYAAFDSARSVRRVLRLPLPPAGGGELVPAGIG
jgi:hypothetical protein